MPVTLTVWTRYNSSTDGYTVDFDLHYNQTFRGARCHILSYQLERDEREAVQIMHWTADRYFWRNRYPHLVDIEVKKSLAKYRAEVDETRIPVSAFREVDFG
jgi:hypothetical protein